MELAGAQGEPPTHFITLTLRESLPLWRQAPAAERVEQRQAAVALARCLSRAFSRLVAEIREQFGAFEYMALVELTTGRRTPGHRPHLHLLARSSRRIPRAWLSRRWAFHTRGSHRVDIQPLRSVARAVAYHRHPLVGHIMHMRQLAVTTRPGAEPQACD